MTEGTPRTDTAHAGVRSQAALDRYTARTRPRQVAYFAMLAAASLVLAVVVKIAYAHGEISHATLRTVTAAPPAVRLQTPSAALTQAWASADRSAIGVPYWGGTVVTFDKHSMRGRAAGTGRVTWTFTRTDRTLCQAVQEQGVSIAVFELHGNCDQLTALDTDTGARKWVRTLDKDGAEVNGHPRITASALTLMLTTPSAIYALDPSSGLDRWVFRQNGCSVRSAVLGSSGALISQQCRHRVCGDDRFCGDGSQLVLRDPTAGENTDSATNKRNPDQIIWNTLGSDLVPASAGSTIAAVQPDGARLVVLSAKKGVVRYRVPLRGASTAVSTSSAADADLLHIGALTYALQEAAATLRWQVRTAGVPTVTGRSDAGLPTLSSALLTIASDTGIASLDPLTGTVQRSFAVPLPAAGSAVYPFGHGFLVAGAKTIVYR